MKRFKFSLILGLLVLWAQLAQAAVVCEPDPAGARSRDVANRWNQLLVERKFDVLDEEIEDRFQRVRTDQVSDFALAMDLDWVTGNDAQLEPYFAEWNSARNTSKYAPLLAGMYHVHQAYLKRGIKYAAETSVEQFAAMESEFELARKYLALARKRDPANAMNYRALLDIAKASRRKGVMSSIPWRVIASFTDMERMGFLENTVSVWRQGIARDPASLALRLRATATFNPKWGGSYGLLDQVLASAEKSPLQEPDRRYLAYRVHMEKADYERYVSKRQREALRYAVMANAACPSTSALWLASESGFDLQDWPAVKDFMDAYLEMAPSATRALSKRGWALENMGDMPKAIEDYMRAIKLGDAWAMNRVGWFYETNRHLPKDLVKARALYEQASARGNPTAREALAKMQQAD